MIVPSEPVPYLVCFSFAGAAAVRRRNGWFQVVTAGSIQAADTKAEIRS